MNKIKSFLFNNKLIAVILAVALVAVITSIVIYFSAKQSTPPEREIIPTAEQTNNKQFSSATTSSIIVSSIAVDKIVSSSPSSVASSATSSKKVAIKVNENTSSKVSSKNTYVPKWKRVGINLDTVAYSQIKDFTASEFNEMYNAMTKKQQAARAERVDAEIRAATVPPKFHTIEDISVLNTGLVEYDHGYARESQEFPGYLEFYHVGLECYCDEGTWLAYGLYKDANWGNTGSMPLGTLKFDIEQWSWLKRTEKGFLFINPLD
ncbi:MAG: hypothetical protein WAX04_08525 [Oscillospiraceae bacterium]